MQITRGAHCISAHEACPTQRLLESVSKEALHLAAIDAARTAHQYVAHGARIPYQSILATDRNIGQACDKIVKRMPGQYYGRMTAHLHCSCTVCHTSCSPNFGAKLGRSVAFVESREPKARYAYTETQTSNKEGFTCPLQGAKSSQ